MKTTLLAALLGLLVATSAHAIPISYNATLSDGVPVTGQISATNTASAPVGAQYYSFSATAGSMVNVVGDRLEGAFDMAFWIYQGLFVDTNDFGASFSFAGPGFIAFGDDQDAPNIAGPFGDPNITFTAGTTGFYTVAVTNFASGNPGQDGLFDFQLVARGVNNVPAPGGIALLGLGLAALAAVRRRKSA
jgi:PEP-CTERM motif